MSTLSVGTIQSSTTSPPTINNSAGTAIGTFCRAWVNFNGTGTVAIRASFNVTSITDDAQGQYTVNFTNAMVDANYVMGSASQRGATSAAANAAFISFNSSATQPALAAGSFRISTLTAEGSLIDFTVNTVAIFR